ncbi:(R)-mandelonitrile lyase [Hymenobacter metallilatus]|uniref:Cupin domain-containing protein n=1 Tax=Hymenobacter metallilatus TaxID=2493666 RepID=A0A428JCB0_9BACT|nr:cupin domain-containing protein [Hymenobacter metallilatus]RSK29767.1 cupin domain-containing protein [Hymenobacter metallilatus]
MPALKVYPAGHFPTVQAPESSFTGEVVISNYFERPAPSRLVSATVDFAPGARTPWKVNPRGQTLLVLSGTGWAQAEGEDIVEIRAGDMVWCPPGQRHWEGATPTQPMTYLAMQEFENGRSVEFQGAVTDEEYLRGPAGAAPRP